MSSYRKCSSYLGVKHTAVEDDDQELYDSSGSDEEATQAALMFDTDYSNNGKDRKITRYHDVAGKLPQAEEQYKNNKPAGTWKEFYPNGKTPRKTASQEKGKRTSKHCKPTSQASTKV